MDKYIDNGELTAVGESVVGQVRSANEDFCGYLSTVNGELFVVCDGMGGHVGGAEASKTAVSYIIKTLAEQQYDDIAVAIHNALITANRAVYEKGRMNPALSGMGTTACVLVVRDGKAWIAHVGDSRIYLFTARDKTLHRITKDHSFVQSQVDLGLLDDRDAENHPRKNVILKALGIREELNVDVAQMPVLPSDGDVFLICSDGLSGMIDDTYIEDVLANNPDVETALGILIDSANAPGKGTDNITTQLIKIKGVQREQSEFVDYNPLWRRQAIVNMPTLDFGDNTPVMPVPKKKKSKAWIWILLGIIGLLILVGAGTWAFFSLKDRNKNIEPTLEEQIDQLKAENKSDQAHLEDINNEINEEENEQKKQKKIGVEVAQMRKDKLEELNASKGSLEKKIELRDQTIKSLEENLKTSSNTESESIATDIKINGQEFYTQYVGVPAGEFSCDVSCTGSLKACKIECTQDWYEVTLDGSQLRVKYQENINDKIRKGEITVSSGDISATLKIEQKAASSRIKDNHWYSKVRKLLNTPTLTEEVGLYRGNVNNCRAEGLGLFFWTGDPTQFYVGGWSDHKQNGKGIYAMQSGYTYPKLKNCRILVSNFSDNQPDGYMTCYNRLGVLLYEGRVTNGVPNNEYPSSKTNKNKRFDYIEYGPAYYIGETLNGQRHGYGLYVDSDGNPWIGNWANDQKQDGSSF